MAEPADLSSTVYDHLRRVAAAKLRDEPAGHTLDATALVHEADRPAPRSRSAR